MFNRYLDQRSLLPDGAQIITHSSRLLPVRYKGMPAMLTIAIKAEEKFWAGLSAAWWISDSVHPKTDLRIAALAAANLGLSA